MLQLKKKLETVNMDTLVESIRSHIGYTPQACIAENEMLAGCLNSLGVYCEFKFGEAVLFPCKGSPLAVHRNLTWHGRIKSDRRNFHCWLDVEEKVLDIAVGTWTKGYGCQQYRMPYLYDVYCRGFDMDSASSYDDVNYSSEPPHRAHHYKAFDEKRGRSIIGCDYPFYDNNLLMYDNPWIDAKFEKTVKSIIKMYKLRII